MAPRAALALAALSLVLACAAPRAASAGAAWGNTCPQVPNVAGADQTPSDPAQYGKCTKALEPWVSPSSSHWCKFGQLGMWPDGPSARAKECLKFGRATIYRGPIYGSSAQHKAACNKWITGEDRAALVAVSTKYLKTYQGGWQPDKGTCGQCMCIRLHGADDKFNSGLQRDPASRNIGLTFLGQVGDRCAECEDDHIDLLQDRPLSFAPFNPAANNDNTNAPYVNAKDGLRGLSDPALMRGSQFSLENAGAWTADWQFVPCSYTHETCANLMRSMGYAKVWTPKMTPGVDSFSMRPISQLRGTKNDRLFKFPWA